MTRGRTTRKKVLNITSKLEITPENLNLQKIKNK